MSEEAATVTDAPEVEPKWQDWEVQAEQKKQAIDAKWPIDAARAAVEAFAAKHNIKFVDAAYCGFGRPCVGFCDSDDKYIQYDPIDMNMDVPFENFDERYIVHSGEVGAPDGVEAYHKSDYLCVLKRDCDTNLVKHIVGMLGAMTGNDEAVKNSDAMEDAEVPQESTDRAIRQIAEWITVLEERGTVSIVEYDTRETGLQALIDGGTKAHAIVVTPREEV